MRRHRAQTFTRTFFSPRPFAVALPQLCASGIAQPDFRFRWSRGGFRRRELSALVWRSKKGLRWRPVTGRWVGAAGCGASDPREGGTTFVLRPEPTPNWTSTPSCCGAFFVASSRPSPAPRDSCHWGPAGVSRETWVSF